MNDEETGTVTEVLPKALYRVELPDGRIIVASLSNTLRHVISRLIVGDQVVLRSSRTQRSDCALGDLFWSADPVHSLEQAE